MMYASIYMKSPEQANPYTELRLVIARGWGEERIESDYYEISFRGDENVLKLTVITVAQLYEKTKSH